MTSKINICENKDCNIVPCNCLKTDNNLTNRKEELFIRACEDYFISSIKNICSNLEQSFILDDDPKARQRAEEGIKIASKVLEKMLSLKDKV